MKKNRIPVHLEGLKKVFFIMRLSFYLILLTFLQVSANVYAQHSVDLNFKNVTLHDVLWELQKQTGCVFLYSTADVKTVKLEEVSMKQKTVQEVLDKCLENTGLTYNVHNDVIVIKKSETPVGLFPTAVVVKGKVVDGNGESLPGVSVRVKGTQSGVATDIAGNFEIKLPDIKNVVLIFSFVGMKTREVTVPANGSPMKVVLESEQEQLEEVIITGYGTFKKSAYAGSATTVKTKELQDVPAVSFTQMLQGAAPGVNITESAGIPGATTSIRIRGMGSFNASNSPLYVIDGVPVMSGNIGASGSDSGLDVMTTLNTSDIENVTVIKDAAAASLYGSRAANGVVLITTKQGRKGKPVFNLKADWGFSKFAMDFREMMGGQERRNMIHEGLRNKALTYTGKDDLDEGLYQGMSEGAAWAYADRHIDEFAPIPWCGFVDWKDYMFRTGRRDNYEFSASGGQDKLKFYTSIGYMKQDGVAINSGLERISGRLNIEYEMNNWLTFGAKMLFSKVNQNTYSEGTGYVAPIYATTNGVTPSDPVWNEDGTWNQELLKLDNRNPLLANTYNYKKENATRAFNTVYASFKLYKELKFKSTYSYDFVINKSRSWKDPKTSDGITVNGRFDKDYNEINKWVWSNILTYQKVFADKHNLDVLVGYELNDSFSDGLGVNVSNFARADRPEVNTGVVFQGKGGSHSSDRLISYLTRLNYDYKSKYYFGASWRTDGSSRLARAKRWGQFWSVSGAWRISAEDFMRPAEKWLSDLKIRVSYGVNGTLPSSKLGYLGLSSLTNKYNNNPGIAQSQLENADLSWEKNYNFNTGIDISLWNRLNLTVEYYVRTTKDLLYSRPLSVTTGFTSYLDNIGKLKNQGIEVEIRSTNFDRKDFSWTTSLNLGHNRNKVLRLDGELPYVISGVQIHKVGKPYSTYYMIEFAGIDPQDGLPQFYVNKKDRDGKLNRTVTKDPREAEKVEMKCADPKLTGGFINNLRYKWFDLGFTFNFSLGGWSYDGGASKMEHGGTGNLNIPVYYRKRWQKPGDKTSIERFIVDRSLSMKDYATDRRLHIRDFLRLKNLTFGITVPKMWTQKIGIDKARLFMSGNNLLTWAAYQYYDPEIGSSVSFDTPPLRTMTFGLDINF